MGAGTVAAAANAGAIVTYLPSNPAASTTSGSVALSPTIETPGADCVIRWPMSAAAGANEANAGSGGALDLIPRGAPGPIRGAPGLFGNSSRTGNVGWFTTAALPAIVVPASFTMCIWTKPEGIYQSANWHYVFGKKFTNGVGFAEPFWSACLYIYNMRPGGSVAVGGVRKNVGPARAGANNYPGVSVGDWHHMVLTFDNGTGIACLYLDGALVDAAALGGAMDAGTNGEWILAGQRIAVAGLVHYGQVEEAQVYNVVKDATWVRNQWKRLRVLQQL